MCWRIDVTTPFILPEVVPPSVDISGGRHEKEADINAVKMKCWNECSIHCSVGEDGVECNYLCIWSGEHTKCAAGEFALQQTVSDV